MSYSIYLYLMIFIYSSAFLFLWGNLCNICNVCYHCMIYFVVIYRCDLKKIQVWWSRCEVEVIYEIFVVICMIYFILILKNSRSGGVGGRWRQGAEVGQPLQTTAPLHFMFCRIIYTWCIFIHLVYNIHLLFLYVQGVFLSGPPLNLLSVGR